MTSAGQKRKRSTIPKAEARRRYIEAAELVVLDQIRKDSRLLDERAIAVGPFARLDANAVAAHEGKTRGAINNLFGSQAVFQAETSQAIARNPVFGFKVKGAKAGDKLSITWTDNKGDKRTDEVTLGAS